MALYGGRGMKSKIIASVYVPAIGAPTGWIRSAKTIHITNHTPAWMVRIIDEWGKASQH